MLKECKNCHLGLVNGVKTCEVCGGRGAVEVDDVITPVVSVTEHEAPIFKNDGIYTAKPDLSYKKSWYKFW